jgi:Na+/melibiose symporter-like transporter
MMTATKAVAGGVAANVVTVVLWGISTIPGWHAVPDEPKAAILGLVSALVGAAIVYFAPSNKQTLTATAPVTGRERSGLLQPGSVLAGATN